MNRMPMTGVRVLDLTRVYAGPICTKMWTDMGAEVTKIETVQRLDMPPRGHSYAENEPGEEPWNRAAHFHLLNSGKRGVTLDLNSPQGIALFKRLVQVSDVVVENYSPRVMKNFGIDYPVLRKLRPDIIMVSLSGYGQTGPQREYLAYATVIEAACLSAFTGYPNGKPVGSGTAHADWTLGSAGAAAGLMALLYRNRTGKGQHVDVAGREAMATRLGEFIMDYVMNKRRHGPIGNDHPAFAPHGCYPALGEDRWVAIAVRSDDEWRELKEAMGNPAWADDPKFETALGRWDNRAMLSGPIGEWTRDREPEELARELQRRGIPASVVFDVRDVLLSPHYKERGLFQVIAQTRVGKRPLAKQMPARFSGAAEAGLSPAPLLGEHNRLVLGDVLGVPDAEMHALEEAHVIGSRPLNPYRPLKLPLQRMEADGSLVDKQYARKVSSVYDVI